MIGRARNQAAGPGSVAAARIGGGAIALLLLIGQGCAPKGGEAGAVPGTVTLAEPGSPFVAFDLWFEVGSQNDPKGKEGLAALTADLLADGSTQQDSYTAILEKLYPMATGYSASTDKEMTTFRGVVHRDNLDGYYELIRNAVLSPAFLEEDFQRVKQQTLDYLERGRRFQRDEELSKELLFWRAYRGTPYQHPTAGYVTSVRAITLDDVRSFYASHYLRSNVVVGIGGGYPDGLVARARADFDRLPEGEVPAVEAPRPQMPEGIKVLLVEKDTDASAISIGYPLAVRRGGPDFFEMTMVSTWLGDHRSSFSHLYQVIRERRGMNYGDYAYIEAFPRGFTTQERPVNFSRRSQLFEIWIRPISATAPGNLHDRTLFAVRAAWRELAKLAQNGLPATEVDRTREYLHNFSVTFGSTALRRLAFAIDDAYYGMSPGYLESVRPALARATTESVNEAIKRHVQAGNLWLVIITKDAAALEAKLLSGEPTPITYAGEQPAALLEEDREIAAFPLPVTEDDIEIIDILQVLEGGS